MDLMLQLNINPPEEKIDYRHRVMMLGSCFAEETGKRLKELKLNILQNPHGILFDPVSICKSLASCIDPQPYSLNNLFQYQETWNSWQHHGRFSHTDPATALAAINQLLATAHLFLKDADWLIITPGTSFVYRLTEKAEKGGLQYGDQVSNCHKAPAAWFTKHLLGIDEIIASFDNCYHQLLRFNPRLKIIFTVSPVRHTRDGIVENNRSKSRLIEAVHHMVNKFDHLYYFPAYELLIDVLRDYRFYAEDLVHPDKKAVDYIAHRFLSTFLNPSSQSIMKRIGEIVAAKNHRPHLPGTKAHRLFLETYWDKVAVLQKEFPFLDLQDELIYFSDQPMTL
ncbi:MAG: GSCFA domain-containing protein [Terrimonas sp.]|nr:GSCFA domain-containing protein [Terrimonas sp.]